MHTKTAHASTCSSRRELGLRLGRRSGDHEERVLGIRRTESEAGPAALSGVNAWIAPIHAGIGTSSPARGLPLHCLAASARSTTPNASLSRLTHVDGSPPSLASAVSASTRTSVPRPAMPATQPSVYARPLARGRALTSMSTATMIGGGLAAIAIAIGSICPNASPIDVR